jgi:hypothetical protein
MEPARPFEHLFVLRCLIVTYLLCTLWFKVAPDTLSESLRAVERSLDNPEHELLDNVVVALLYARAILCLFLWSPTRVIAWLFALSQAAIFGLGAFGLPSFLSPLDTLVDGLQAMSVTAILTVLFVGGIFGRAKGFGRNDA